MRAVRWRWRSRRQRSRCGGGGGGGGVGRGGVGIIAGVRRLRAVLKDKLSKLVPMQPSLHGQEI